jgi:hypothetical protein
MSIEELQKVVFERLQSGESIESIKIDLKENGIVNVIFLTGTVVCSANG